MGMAVEIKIDAEDLRQLIRAINNLPGEIKAKAMARAMHRLRDMARTQIVRRNAERTDLKQAEIRKKTTAYFNAGGNTIEIVERSGWIPLYALGATQTKRGVRVRLRGSYKSAFIAKMGSGHVGVMKREGTGRLPIRELFGPNPSHDITNNPDVYLEVMAGLINGHLAPRIMHEIGRLLPR